MVATPTDVDALLDRALAHSRREQTEALYLGQDLALTRFATNQIHQNVREHDAKLQVRVIDGDRIGVASTNRLDEAGIRVVVARATAIAERSAPNPRAAVLPEPDGREHDPELGLRCRHGRRRARAPRRRRPRGDRRRRGGKGLQTSGSFSTSAMTIAVANSLGVRARHRSSRRRC